MTHSFDKHYWDPVWHGDGAAAMGASPANPHLVREIGGLVPGTALDAGCGAGAEAIWLAEHGWRVTAVDIAAEALATAARRTADAGVADRVRWVEADLSTWEPQERYDLVTTHYAHPAMPQLEFYDRIGSWVAPGGTLLIVGHLHAGHHAGEHGNDHGDHHGDDHGDHHRHGHRESSPPASASVTAADITARLDPASWSVETARESQRSVAGPGGRPTTVRDVVVRARATTREELR
ncbi:MAG TPA: class I SAM-dependent methyltransferase [Nocardioides sp.]|nr:class I SAM-dependent methyltransferase [Nocardioides sp.]